MVIQCLDLLLGCLACVVLHGLILICVVLVLFMLTVISSFFVLSLFWLIKLILVHVNFITDMWAIINKKISCNPCFPRPPPRILEKLQYCTDHPLQIGYRKTTFIRWFL
jgi:hypothetical protein